MKKEKLRPENNQPGHCPEGFNHLQIIERRHFIRHPLSLPLTYKIIKPECDKKQKNIQSETSDVSMGGLLFPAKHSVEPDSMIAIKMPFENKMFNIKAKVIRCVNNPETKFYDIAVSFLRFQESFKAKMIEQIYLISEYRDLLSLQLGQEVPLEEASRKWIKRYSERFKRLYW